jgi:hypothetical protein
MWQWRLSINYTLLIRLFRLISWPAWLEWLFDDNGRWVMLVIIEDQWTFMMSRYWSLKMKFHPLHLRHDLHICSFVSCALFAKHSFWKDLVRIKMSLIREMNILSEWVHRFDHMTTIILHPQLLIFEANELDYSHSISISLESSSIACSLHCTRRAIKLKVINLNVSRHVTSRIFFAQHLIQFILRYFYWSINSIFAWTTHCRAAQRVSLT